LFSYLNKKYSSYNLLNLDIKEPHNLSYKGSWKKCDVKNEKLLNKFIFEFNPTHVIHLAAKASLTGNSLKDFPDNIIGTENIVNCIKQIPSLKCFIHTSTQYVIKPGNNFKTEFDYAPYTAYGASKVESEKIVLNANLNCNWAIIRPTNIWGPWHSVFPYELWPYLSKRLYFHPGYKPITKHYGFVYNSVIQIDKIMNLNPKFLNQVFYITDPPIDNSEWMNSFSIILTGKPVIKVPKMLWKILGLFGDFIKKIIGNCPIDTERYFRLTINEKLPYKKTIELLGNPTYSLEEGVTITKKWIDDNFPHLMKVK